MAVLNVCYLKESRASSREQVREELEERNISRLNQADGALDVVGRLSQWCPPLGSTNVLGKKKESGYT